MRQFSTIGMVFVLGCVGAASGLGWYLYENSLSQNLAHQIQHSSAHSFKIILFDDGYETALLKQPIQRFLSQTHAVTDKDVSVMYVSENKIALEDFELPKSDCHRFDVISYDRFAEIVADQSLPQEVLTHPEHRLSQSVLKAWALGLKTDIIVLCDASVFPHVFEGKGFNYMRFLTSQASGENQGLLFNQVYLSQNSELKPDIFLVCQDLMGRAHHTHQSELLKKVSLRRWKKAAPLIEHELSVTSEGFGGSWDAYMASLDRCLEHYTLTSDLPLGYAPTHSWVAGPILYNELSMEYKLLILTPQCRSRPENLSPYILEGFWPYSLAQCYTHHTDLRLLVQAIFLSLDSQTLKKSGHINLAQKLDESAALLIEQLSAEEREILQEVCPHAVEPEVRSIAKS